ncbi:MAG: enoyl-CoA hydratase/isomerase family protein [Ruminococcus sp.]|nr:enoyl-CoA hydratase/isomerase family protein [Ruminococcus sp.]
MIKSKISTLTIIEDSAVLTIENGKKNLLTDPEFIGTEVLQKFVDDNPHIKSLIIRGAGRHFSHGADISRFNSSEDISVISGQLESARKLLDFIESLPIVTISAVNGGCFGGGLETALACHFRICAKNVFMGLPEVMHGVLPGMCGMERLTRLIGRKKALEMCLSGAIISASDALEIGLADKVTDNNDCFSDALTFAKELTEDKTILQIHNIIETINLASDGEKNSSKGRFEQVLQEKWETEK